MIVGKLAGEIIGGDGCLGLETTFVVERAHSTRIVWLLSGSNRTPWSLRHALKQICMNNLQVVTYSSASHLFEKVTKPTGAPIFPFLFAGFNEELS
jgi:hypothetical protein